MLRPVNPADLPSLLALQARTLPNAARSRKTLASGARWALPYGALIGVWLPRGLRRHAWLLSRRGMAAGVVEVHQRLGPTCWEVGCLQARRSDGEALIEMLEAASGAVADLKGRSLFLRLDADSPANAAAGDARFTQYSFEELFVRQAGTPLAPAAPPDNGLVRRAGDEDNHAIYRLYQAVEPAPAREAKGMTFGQWQDSLELPQGWRRRETFVLDRGADVAGCLMLSGSRRDSIVDVLITPEDLAGAESLISAGLHAAGGARKVLCLAPGHQQFLARPLQALGFRKSSELVLHVRHTTARVKERELVPAGAMPR